MPREGKKKTKTGRFTVYAVEPAVLK